MNASRITTCQNTKYQQEAKRDESKDGYMAEKGPMQEL